MHVDVAVDADDDGSGAVRVAVALDEEASRRIEDLSAHLVVEDLQAAGWTVEPPADRPDGGTAVAAEKPFATAAELGKVVEELAGTGGPLRNFTLAQETGPLTTTYTLEGEVDLTAGVEGFSDDDLRQRLQGSGFGLDRESLERETGIPLEQLFELRVITDLPGSLADEWPAPVGQRTPIVASSRQIHVQRVAWFAVAVASALALVALLTRRALSGRRPAE